jgi:CoA:oxalate CoA-transferase
MSTAHAAGPLAGIVVADLTRVLAGPYCTQILGDLGARVIKIETPETGDDARAMGPFVDGESMYFLAVNRGKESIALDLRLPDDRSIFEKILARADVLVENFRPGTMEKLGYPLDALRQRFPKLVSVSISGFGQTGPDSRKAAYDLVVQGLGGIMSLTGPEGGPPVRVGTSIGDLGAGLFAAAAVNAALLHRERTGEARSVDVAMLDCQLALLENAIVRYTATATVPKPLGTRHPAVTPFEAFPASDGQVIVAAGNDALFARLCGVLALDALPSDPRFATNRTRTENVEALHVAIAAVTAGGTVADWLARLSDAGIPCAPINTVAEAIAEPQVAARNMLVEAPLASGRTVRLAGNPLKIAGFPDPAARGPAPILDQDRNAILRELAG